MVVHAGITSEVMSGSNINDANDPLVQYMNEIIDHVSLGVIFDVHRSIRLGTFHVDDIDKETQNEFEIVDEVGVDVFGQQPMKKPIDCVCPNCQRNMAANRFAPHLEKCMGMGRNSSRIASRRIATSGKMEEFDIDDDYDNDWSYEFEKKGKKIKREKILNSPRRGKAARRDAGGSRPSTPTSNASVDVSNNLKAGPTLQALEDLSQEEKIALLTQTCGARSEHTGKMCTRTGKCVQHTDEQRRAVRELLFGEGDDLPLPPFMKSEGSSLDQDDIHVDVDGYEDIDATPLLRDLNQMAWEEGSNISTGSDTTPTFQVVTKHSKKAKGRKTRSR